MFKRFCVIFKLRQIQEINLNLLGALGVGDSPVVNGDVVFSHWVATLSRGPVTGHAPAALVMTSSL